MTNSSARELRRAEQLFSIGQLDGAIDTLRRVLTDDPDLADAHAWLAACLLRKRRLHAARVEAGIALAQAPESLLAHWVSAELAIAAREFAGAERHIERLLAEAPQAAEFHRLRARLLGLTGRDREQLPVLEQALACDPQDPETLADLADCHRAAGRLDEADRYAREALAIESDHISALVAMGHVLLERGDTDGARELALSALQADPENPGALALLTAIKARSNFLLGLWWRYATWGMRVGPTRNIVVLLIAYIAYRALLITADDMGATTLAGAVNLVWLAIVVYSFAGPVWFQSTLRRELESVRIRRF